MVSNETCDFLYSVFWRSTYN